MTGKDIAKITFNLVAIYFVGGLLMAIAFAMTSPVIFKKEKAEKEATLKAMFPQAAKAPEILSEWKPYGKKSELFKAEDANGPIGYIIETYGKGYSSYIHVFAAVDKDMKVQKIDILSHAETPGLGDEILSDDFKGRFIGKDLDHLKVIKGESDEAKANVQAITGATISSRAVTNGVKDGLAELKNKLAAAVSNTPAPSEHEHGHAAIPTGGDK